MDRRKFLKSLSGLAVVPVVGVGATQTKVYQKFKFNVVDATGYVPSEPFKISVFAESYNRAVERIAKEFDDKYIRMYGDKDEIVLGLPFDCERNDPLQFYR